MDEIIEKAKKIREMSYHGENRVLFEQNKNEWKGDPNELMAALQQAVFGEVRFDAGSRALYATDGSNYRQTPIGVVIPHDKADVINTVRICKQFGAPVLPRGGGTSLAGQCCNVAVVMDMTKYMNRVLAIDVQAKTATVQPGTVLDDLRNAAEEHDLTFGPDPATHDHCSLGGMIGNNSCGVHSIMAGRTADNVEELTVLTYDGLVMTVGPTSEAELGQIIAAGGRKGEIYARLKDLRDRYADQIRARYPDIPRLVSGYSLQFLLPENGFNVARALVGSEGTCVTVLEAKLNLIHNPSYRTLVVLGYTDIYVAGDHVEEIMSFGPVGLEGIDDQLVSYMQRTDLHPADLGLLPKGGGWLLVEFGGESKADSDAQAHKMMDALKKEKTAPTMKLYDDPRQEKRIWEIRESGLGATAKVPGMPDTWPGWEDLAVSPDRLGDYLRDLRKLMDRYGYKCALYGHFGQACVHVRIDFDLLSQEGINQYLSFIDDASDLVMQYGGSFSGEHGDGQSRAALLPKMFGDDLVHAFEEFKAIWDPQGKMNPGKVVDPYRPDENLRLGTDFKPWTPATHFNFTADQGSFAKAAARCVGVGKCRREEGGTMCPSYMVTREEKDSTRGRARLLFEMLDGKVIGKNGWKDAAVKDALDLCLACKGCKGDCPVNVDMATYKAEFLSHYYEGSIRPPQAYAFGLIHRWATLASWMPGLANLATHMPVLGPLMKKATNMAPEREFPAFASRTFKMWFHQRPAVNLGKPEVILWADTFNDNFHPETLQAGVEVLEAAGYKVVVSRQNLCCGRPLYDWGMLAEAKKLLRQVLTTLRAEIRAGIPVVVLEPSCAAVFRDELMNLFHQDEDALRLKKQTYTLAEFIEQRADGFQLPHLEGKAVVHGHCHQKAIFKMHADERVLKNLGLDYELLDSGCCGMAGAFGFEKGDHYKVSIQAGERVLLPAVRQAKPETIILADGFSCREQISQQTDRHALHLAQVIQMALHQDQVPAKQAYPEKRYLSKPADTSLPAAALFVSAMFVIGRLIARAIRKTNMR